MVDVSNSIKEVNQTQDDLLYIYTHTHVRLTKQIEDQSAVGERQVERGIERFLMS